jgi:2-isopropylmalate synthase
MPERVEAPSPNRVQVFDTTLRDGAQMPGIHLSPEDKIAIATQLSEIGVDIIEAGFPSSSEQNFEATRSIAETVAGSVICAFSGTGEGDIETAWEAIEPARHNGGARLNTCLPVSDLHMEKRLGMTPDQTVERAVAAVARAKTLTDDVEFSAEDASRADSDFLTRVVLAVADAGATTIMIPDTVGKTLPDEYAELTARVRGELDTRGFGGVVVAAHCHNDMGLAEANTLRALEEGGAGQMDVTVGGLGERAGNASLEQLAAIAHERPERGILTAINTTRLTRLAQDVAQRGGIHLQPHLPVVGKNAFRHTSGWHQHGITRDVRTFEHLRAEDYGQKPGQFVISDQSGRAGISRQLEDIVISVEKDDLTELREGAEELAKQTGRRLAHSDLEELSARLSGEELVDRVTLDFDQLTERTAKGVSTVTLVVNDIEKTGRSPKGPVDAAKLAINEALGFDGDIDGWDADAPESGSDSTVGAFATVKVNGYEVEVYAVERSSDFASIAAYIKGINMIYRIQERLSSAND